MEAAAKAVTAREAEAVQRHLAARGDYDAGSHELARAMILALERERLGQGVRVDGRWLVWGPDE